MTKVINVMKEFGKETSSNSNHIVKDIMVAPKKEVLDNNYPNFFV